MKDLAWDQLEVGLGASFSATITSEMMDRFLAITADNNPLHIDSAVARERGFKDRVVYGLLTSSFYSTLVGVHLPGKRALLQGVNATFNRPAYVGDRLTISGTIVHLSEAYHRIEIAAYIEASGALLSKAKIMVGLLV